MSTMSRVLRDYLVEVLDLQVKIQPWEERDVLPFFLIDTYDFYETSFLKRSSLLVVAKEGVELTPVTIKKHFEQIRKRTTRLCVFVQSGTTFYNRKRLIEQRISFIIPGNQLYLPELGIELRDYFHKEKADKNHLSPATQTVLIYVLMDQRGGALTPSQLSGQLGYTPMTMSRAFDELESKGIGKIDRKGKERLLSFKESKKEIWGKARPLMRDPVKRQVWAKGEKPKLIAGISALAKETLLAHPSIPIYAVSLDERKRMEITELPNRDDAEFELEIWHYDPGLFANRGTVDPFSLYLSLKESEEERVEIALEGIMEKVKW
ncbi:MAG: hypothetical protein S4CHLAM2_00190 [Chlamydiales bacterium]|nr:hypothetical protein [Chlamydiales bacterium]